ncbi:CCA tRNA nucleotidyltransferase [Arcobacter sp. FWKO B]|uniref:CCA tRNA nucleotidyltransferase n=1 Tax=Arcobacter sp. FWKO B TaxID=2593672 RepID=UPI0018A4C7AE|nr:CCA tRNA nucleotidyltransferase [Arcobacter sp. FWKO B]QOG11478.1 CCA tRNA nucleotidyltransferase [Arcobacter sp. FWKO B]
MKQQTLENLSSLKLALSKYTKKAYFVGGYVRDTLLQKESDDIDIEVYDINPDDFTTLMQTIGAVGVGKSFFVYKYGNIDISLPRTEIKTGYGHTGFDVSYCNDEKIASKRRDFTINAMMKNIFTGEVFDFFGGINDLDNKILKVVDSSTFAEDSLRVLRGVRFASKFGFKIEKDSLYIMQNIPLDDLSNERVSKEFEMIFSTSYLEYAFYYLCKLNLIDKYFHKNITTKEFLLVCRLLIESKKYFNNEIYEYYFLYILKSVLNIDFSFITSNKYYKFLQKQPSLNFEITDKELLEISLDIPISLWLGALSQDIKNRALKYDIWDKTLDTRILAQDVIKDGFSKESIKSELLKRKLKFIDDKITLIKTME